MGLFMLSRKRSVSGSVVLLATVFAVGAGAGALIIALSNSGHRAHGVVKHVVATATRALSTGNTQAPSTTTATAGPSAPQQHRTHRAPATSLVSASAADTFAMLAAGLGGQIGLAVAPLGQGPVQTFGTLAAGHAWSTMKVPVLITLLADYERSGQVLSAAGHTDAAVALEQSDNAAAERLFSALEQIHGGLVAASFALEQTLSKGGDPTTTINTAPNDQGFTTWGQSVWSAAGEVQVYRALADGCLLGPHDTAYVLRLMRGVIPSQRWGAGAAGFSPVLPLAFKAGWGPDAGGGYLVRQTAIVGSDNRGYVVSMIARPSGGSFDQGVSMVNALATWARQHLQVVDAPPLRCKSVP